MSFNATAAEFMQSLVDNNHLYTVPGCLGIGKTIAVGDLMFKFISNSFNDKEQLNLPTLAGYTIKFFDVIRPWACASLYLLGQQRRSRDIYFAIVRNPLPYSHAVFDLVLS